MNTIIFIGTNKSGSSRDAIKAAEQLGYFTVVFTNNEKQIKQREEYTDVHEMVLMDTNLISEMKKEINTLKSKGKAIKMIVSFIDSNVHLASILCDEYCKNVLSSTAIEIMENKEKTRVYLKNQPYTPKFFIQKPSQKLAVDLISKKLNFPVIVKSPKSTGSKDVLFASEMKELEKNILKLKEKNPLEVVIIEEFIEGKQYLVEAIVHQKKIQIAGVIEQEITIGKRFIVTGYGVHADVPNELTENIHKVLESIISQLGIVNGALHFELRLSKNGWKLIEINPRISGGAMNKMLQAAFGFNLVEETLKLYLGEIPSIKPTHRKYVFTQYLLVSKKGILEKVTGKGRARKSLGVIEVYVKPRKGTKLVLPLSMGHRYAYVIATGANMKEAKELAKNAANEIEFHLTEEVEGRK